VYDTQCGAKFFRATPALSRALDRPFRSRWAFDVELLGRLLSGGAEALREDDLLEVPLRRWTHVGGSKLRPLAMLRAGADLAVIALDLARERRAHAQPVPRRRPGS
jgi:dolichyl-phosphate beta-glucosyltransferase